MSSAGATVEVTDEVVEGIAAVKSDENPTKWMVAEYQLVYTYNSFICV